MRRAALALVANRVDKSASVLSVKSTDVSRDSQMTPELAAIIAVFELARNLGQNRQALGANLTVWRAMEPIGSTLFATRDEGAVLETLRQNNAHVHTSRWNTYARTAWIRARHHGATAKE
jgi:hypothetical protein